jgi:hypothetical protein
VAKGEPARRRASPSWPTSSPRPGRRAGVAPVDDADAGDDEKVDRKVSDAPGRRVGVAEPRRRGWWYGAAGLLLPPPASLPRPGRLRSSRVRSSARALTTAGGGGGAGDFAVAACAAAPAPSGAAAAAAVGSFSDEVGPAAHRLPGVAPGGRRPG